MKRAAAFSRVLVLSAVGLGMAAGCADGRRDRVVFVGGRGANGEVAGGSANVHQHRGELRPSVVGYDFPASPAEFRQFWHQPCISQGATGQCWAFSSTSFVEAEMYRQTGRKVRLSQAWTVYWDYVGKARRFIQKKGESFFANGSEPNSLLRVYAQYGAVPFEAYTGLPPGRKDYADGPMYEEMVACLNAMKERGEWDEAAAVQAIRTILDGHMGSPPETVQVDGATLTPQEYRRQFAGLDLGEYVTVMSLMQEPWYAWCVYDVPDNWWRSGQYYNVPLADFTRVLRAAVHGGYSLCLLEDVSEPGRYGEHSVAMVPSFDIPAGHIDDSARQFRFSNGTTTDDHAVHIVGYQQRGGRYWYLVKDSGGGPRRGKFDGYMFYDEDYIRLKGLGVVLPRAVVEKSLGRKLGPMPKDDESVETASAG